MVREYFMLRKTDTANNCNVISFNKTSRGLQMTVEQRILNCQRAIIPHRVKQARKTLFKRIAIEERV